MWAHRAGALVWTALAVPAFLWWRDSVAFVIAASLYANVAAALSAASAADDRRVLDKLDHIAEQLGTRRGDPGDASRSPAGRHRT